MWMQREMLHRFQAFGHSLMPIITQLTSVPCRIISFFIMILSEIRCCPDFKTTGVNACHRKGCITYLFSTLTKLAIDLFY